ncbi:MAG: HAD family hydrolase [Prevotella sp.]
MQKKVFAFDFDGTLTTRDTLLEFIRFACGTRAFLAGFMLYSPLLVLMKLHLYSNHKMKERIFRHFFGGMPESRFNALCTDFARYGRRFLRPGAMNVVERALAEGSRVAVISASIDNWVAPFFARLVSPDGENRVTVAGTRIEVDGGVVTGRFSSPNCYGKEKVRRLLELFPDRSSYHLTAFGDSRGDREMLNEADTAFRPSRGRDSAHPFRTVSKAASTR